MTDEWALLESTSILKKNRKTSSMKILKNFRLRNGPHTKTLNCSKLIALYAWGLVRFYIK